MNTPNTFEVIIIGGSYAGLSAAMALGRSLRKTLVIDSGKPCNRQTPHSHNFLTQDGQKPSDIARLARKQVEAYDSVSFLNELATDGKKTTYGFEIRTESGKAFQAKKLIFATGIKDIMPDIKGFAECWGISVIHCPYCHGYEFRSRKTAIMANGDRAFHLASMVNNLTEDITILTMGRAEFSPEQLQKLEKNSVRIVEEKLSEIEHEHGHLSALHFKGGKMQHFDALYASIPFEQHTDLPGKLGCELTEDGYIKIDDFQNTSAEGIFACGDNTSYFRSVAQAVSTGNATGAYVNRELTEEQF
ncbi:NAD(P)/FAD-dependent oxidoreductase [Poritiphilus flavus]|uniref:FAD-dependent oxidoreductase n=1 Tax=Poritiphilus flavus TaxID=2697053 RepID=A0A6L9EHJ8_9FLAO|nr:NAD(P)/FAD-dependent oxidoreductase [Poritiphilus flavus]NAS13968.1 FAD-dependent oxidoreductase [Poritiphilus flavus]